MSISEIIVKVIGIVLAIFGLFIVLANATALPGSWIPCLVGLVALVIGIYIIRGGNFTL